MSGDPPSDIGSVHEIFTELRVTSPTLAFRGASASPANNKNNSALSDAVGLAAGRASDLAKAEWWGGIFSSY